MISENSIAKIKETAVIDDVVGDFVTLKKKGTNLWGLCPFHDEKTPSFSVSPAINIFKCFGCGESGDSIEFLKKHETLTYPEALRYLAEKYQIEIEETQSEINEEQKTERESLFIVNHFAQKFYSETLFDTDEGKAIGLSYFKERGFLEDTIQKFQLGYAPGDRFALRNAAKEKGYDLDPLLKTGLVKEHESRQYEPFSNRVIFPFHNNLGKIVGFGGRILKNDKKAAKYLNSNESELYHKSELLYGLFFAKGSIKKEGNCLLVEGYTDVISLSQSGIENVVASSGTALTTEQLKKINKFTSHLILLYDGDKAGKKAASRGVDLALAEGLHVDVVLLPEDEDPDSFLKANGAESVRNFINNEKLDFVEFKLKTALAENEDDPVVRSSALKEVVKSIALIHDTFERAEFVKKVCRLMALPEQMVINEVNKIRRRNLKKETGLSDYEAEYISPEEQVDHQAIQANPSQRFEMQEKDVIRLLLEYGEEPEENGLTVAEMILNDIQNIRFENETYRVIIDEFIEGIENNKFPTSDHFLNHSNKSVSSLSIELLHSPHEISKNWTKMHNILIPKKSEIKSRDLRSSLCRFKLKKIKQMIEEKTAQAKSTTDEQQKKAHIEILMRLIQSRNTLANELGTVVIP